MDYREINRWQRRIDELNNRIKRMVGFGLVFPILETTSPCRARFTIDRVLGQYRIIDADTGEIMPNKAKDFGREFEFDGKWYRYMSFAKAKCFFENEDAFFDFWEER